MKEKRELAYWGAGDYGKLCVEHYPNIRPDFFIDSNRGENKSYCGIPIKTPDEIRNWNEVFVVITTTAIKEIEKVLNEKKLIRNENYAIYKDFFSVPKESLEEKITKVKRFIEENAEYEKAILIAAPVFISRVSSDMIRFFSQYGIKRKPQKCILFTDLQVIKEEEAKKIMGYPVFDYSELCEWNGSLKPGMEIGKLTHEELLSENEKKWIIELEERKRYENKELSYKVTAEIYWYFKNIFSILKPSKVIIWSGWERQSYILARLAKEAGIIFGYMEHGWIPGTFQFDRYWMEDQCKYDMEPEINLGIESKNTNIRKVRDYILDNKIDTGKFRKTEKDERSLQRIDKNKKTIFFVGYG